MHIKSITLRGILSYKDGTVTFDPKFNVIVGSNGTGKSTILLGIRLAMGEIFSKHTRLLHEHPSYRSITGYVSIVFDNSDHRVTAFDKGDVILRRDFGTTAANDQLSLNGKKISREELLNLLEATGFSQTNPYYIVHQHEITSFVRMSDTERLNLLRDVAGTGVYDKKRAEAATSLEDTRVCLNDIDSTLNMIHNYMENLQEEKAHVEEYLSLEREKEYLENIFTDKQLGPLETSLSEFSLKNENLTSFIVTTENESDQLNAQIDENLELLKQSEFCVNGLQKVIRDSNASIVQLERDILRLTLVHDKAHEQKETQSKQLIMKLEKQKLINEKIQKQELKANKIHLSINEVDKQLHNVQAKHQKALCEFIKLSKTTQEFPDSSYNRHSDDTTATKERLAELEKQRNMIKDRLSEHEKRESEIASKLVETRDGIHQAQKKHSQCEQQKHSLEKTQLHFKQTAELLRTQLQEQELSLNYTLQKLYRTIPPKKLTAFKLMQTWSTTQEDQNLVFGMLLDHLTVEPKYYIAVETALGSRVFNLVVQNRKVALKFLESLEKSNENSCDVSATIIPLNDVKHFENEDATKQVLLSFPNVFLLQNVIECPQHIRPVVKQALERYLLVPNTSVGKECALKGFDCVTLDGDVVSRNGLLLGGYKQIQKRFDLHSQVQIIELKKRKKETQLKSVEKDKMDAATKITQLTKTMFQLESEIEQKRDLLKALNENLDCIQRQRKNLKTSHDELGDSIESIETYLQQKYEAHKDGSYDKLTLKKSERDGVCKKLKQEINTFQDEMDILEEKKKLLNGKLVEAEFELNEYLQPQVLKLSNEIEELKQSQEEEQWLYAAKAKEDRKRDLAIIEQNRDELQEQLVSQREQLSSIKEEYEAALLKSAELQKQLAQSREELTCVNSELSELRFKIDKLTFSKQSVIGSPPDSMLVLSDLEITKRIAAINQRLQSFAHINQKALETFTKYRDEEETLQQKRQDLSQSEESIVQLMQGLDVQKDTTLLKTIENVNLHFSQLFSELIVGAKAKLVLLKRNHDKEESSTAHGRKKKNEKRKLLALTPEFSKSSNFAYSGLAISVQLPYSKSYSPLESLSGGQKTCVALSLLFAIQRVELSPFYIFDEVDANLDIHCRESLALLLQQQAQNHQLIVISHQPEIVQAGNWFLKTSMTHQSTTVTTISREEALEEIKPLSTLQLKASANDENQPPNAVRNLNN